MVTALTVSWQQTSRQRFSILTKYHNGMIQSFSSAWQFVGLCPSRAPALVPPPHFRGTVNSVKTVALVVCAISISDVAVAPKMSQINRCASRRPLVYGRGVGDCECDEFAGRVCMIGNSILMWAGQHSITRNKVTCICTQASVAF